MMHIGKRGLTMVVGGINGRHAHVAAMFLRLYSIIHGPIPAREKHLAKWYFKRAQGGGTRLVFRSSSKLLLGYLPASNANLLMVIPIKVVESPIWALVADPTPAIYVTPWPSTMDSEAVHEVAGFYKESMRDACFLNEPGVAAGNQVMPQMPRCDDPVLVEAPLTIPTKHLMVSNTGRHERPYGLLPS
ncbi:uncharacterized protein ASPGLDRAFT_28451 [Aspergillus glaucus CBS 516.65]|uniref:Uncharacterized protein n=1 Tax=Aspergillus glaucus CBS 516.65 TaxID=1160497 RepID=A0A1L9VBF8_ASPGL|nr:hypothetical protein ASPGLDRAFT_28451 [Aspergillus glaucus CBS 516.65]OJJ81215.1 hypothetical protein ASPGLDRAFT_28451 [Aspergillus glaucus CBS 516.65]